MKVWIRILCLGLLALPCWQACKKTDPDAGEVVRKHIVGRWPLKYQVKSVYIDQLQTSSDTLLTYNPVDTLVFGADGIATWQNNGVLRSAAYSVSDDGETLTFAFNPATTLKIEFLRAASMAIGTASTDQLGGKTRTTFISDYLVKN